MPDPEATPPDAMQPGPAVRVLIVDCHEDHLELLVRLLGRKGHTAVATATDPGQALALLPEVRPHVILIDLRLPWLHGQPLLHHLRRTPGWADLPALVLVGPNASSQIPSAAWEGVSGFIHQPFNGAEITYKIENALRSCRERAAELADLLETDLLSADLVEIDAVPTDPVPQDRARAEPSTARGRTPTSSR